MKKPYIPRSYKGWQKIIKKSISNMKYRYKEVATLDFSDEILKLLNLPDSDKQGQQEAYKLFREAYRLTNSTTPGQSVALILGELNYKENNQLSSKQREKKKRVQDVQKSNSNLIKLNTHNKSLAKELKNSQTQRPEVLLKYVGGHLRQNNVGILKNRLLKSLNHYKNPLLVDHIKRQIAEKGDEWFILRMNDRSLYPDIEIVYKSDQVETFFEISSVCRFFEIDMETFKRFSPDFPIENENWDISYFYDQAVIHGIGKLGYKK